MICIRCIAGDQVHAEDIADALSLVRIKTKITLISAMDTCYPVIFAVTEDSLHDDGFVEEINYRASGSFPYFLIYYFTCDRFKADNDISFYAYILNARNFSVATLEQRKLIPIYQNLINKLREGVPVANGADFEPRNLKYDRDYSETVNFVGRPDGKIGRPLPVIRDIIKREEIKTEGETSNSSSNRIVSRWLIDDFDQPDPSVAKKARLPREVPPNTILTTLESLIETKVQEEVSGHNFIDASVFGPKRIPPGTEFMIQAYLHASEDTERADALAKEADPEAERRGLTTLSIEVPHKTRVHILLEAGGFDIEEPMQSLQWMGEPRACQFIVNVPFGVAPSNINARVRLFVDGAPIGSMRFIIAISAASEVPTPSTILPTEVQRYRHVFLSYASPDRAEVLKRAQALKAAGISFFQDLLALEPGERWERRLYEEIDRSDLFLLFWSAHAAESPWVAREIDRALARAKTEGSDVPDIMPIVLDGPPMTPPPTSLQHIQFTDTLRHIMTAVDTEKLT